MLQFGIDHISAGFQLMRTRPDYYDSGGYLIHLGLECVLKGWWLEIDGQISSEHSLPKIAKRLPDLDYSNLPQNLRITIDKVNLFQHLRYPNLINPIEIGDDVIQPVQELIEYILKKIPKTIIPRLGDEYITKGNRVLAKKRISKAAKKKAGKKSAR